MSKQPDKIWAVSMAPGSRQTPVHVHRKLMRSPAWLIHKMKEVGDPNSEPVPYPNNSISESVIVERLRNEKAELEAKLEAALKGQAPHEDASEKEGVKPETKRGPGRPKKEDNAGN